MIANRFKANSGCFSCDVCGRKTRDTVGNGDLGMCEECFEVSGLENTISDCGDPDGSVAREIDRLNDSAVSKGGAISGYPKEVTP